MALPLRLVPAWLEWPLASRDSAGLRLGNRVSPRYGVLRFLALIGMITGIMPSINCPVGEREIRAALVARLELSSTHGCGMQVQQEVKIGGGRIDVLCLSDCLDGYEIKSDFDSISRLERQANLYSSVLDRATLVVGHELLNEARALLPRWWGVLLAERSRQGGIRFEQLREAKANPADTSLGKAGMLWRNELIDAYEALSGCKAPRSASSDRLRERIVASASAAAVTSIVLRRLQDTARLGAWRAVNR